MAGQIQDLETEQPVELKDQVDRAAVLDRLAALRTLPAGWNGYDADPIDPAILDQVERFISEVPPRLLSHPQVVPMTRGRAQLEWHRGDRSLELEFESPERIHYLRCDPAAGVEEEEILSISEASKLLDLLRWFVATN